LSVGHGGEVEADGPVDAGGDGVMVIVVGGPAGMVMPGAISIVGKMTVSCGTSGGGGGAGGGTPA
jgi:hypothetical protein